MKRTTITLLVAAVVLLLPSCSKDHVESVQTDNAIKVSACVMNSVELSVQTRTGESDEPTIPYTVYQRTTPSTDMPLFAAIWASSVSHSYEGKQSKSGGTPYEINGYVDYHNTTKFTSRAKQLLDYQLYYPDVEAKGNIYGVGNETSVYNEQTNPTGLANSPVYFIGLCPRSESGWSVTSSGSGSYNVAHHAFDGKEDVMYAPEVHKSILNVNQPASLEFYHLLTWIRVLVRADSEIASSSWGRLRNITIKSKNAVNIDTSMPLLDVNQQILLDDNVDHAVSFEGDGTTLKTYKVVNGEYTDKEFEYEYEDENSGILLEQSDEGVELCYVLCAPVIADGEGSSEYELVFDIGNNRELTVPVNLKSAATGNPNFTGSTAGHQFRCLVTFMTGENVSTMATVESWQTGGLALTNITETSE